MITLPKRVHAKPADPLAERLRNARLRLTAQRLGVFQALKKSRFHPTAEDVYRDVRKRFPRISRNTVYLNLEALKRAGETSEVWFRHDAARFEPNSTPHDHAVCISCQKIIDISDRRLRKLRVPRGLAARFKVIRHRVEFLGLCVACGAHRRGKRSRSHR